MKKIKNIICLFVILMFALFYRGADVNAADTTNVNVNIPTKIDIVFNEDGTTSVSEFVISNQSMLPFSLKTIRVDEKNDWNLCASDSEILADVKQIEMKIEQVVLEAGDNFVDIPIQYDTSRMLDIQIRRGAWTSEHALEEAFCLEFEYEFGTRDFQLSFDLNGGEESYEERMITNGTAVELPTPFRTGYMFNGWVDSTNRSYKNQYTMPVRDECLSASWTAVDGFVLYLKDDQSLRFVYPTAPIYEGDMYDGFSITSIFPIRKNSTYTSVTQVPWYDYMYQTKIVKKVIVEDTIQPKSTAFWFYNMRDCELFQLEKLDTSKVVNMASMFGYAAYNATEFEVVGIGEFDVRQVTTMKGMFQYAAYNVPTFYCVIQDWKVYKVTDMSRMFEFMGYNSTSFSIGFLKNWNVQSVTNMDAMFYMTGYRANWYVFLAPWNVSSTVSHVNFNTGVTSKVVAPW